MSPDETPATDKAADATGQTTSDLNALRVKVAELCGWEIVPDVGGGPLYFRQGFETGAGRPIELLPNYPSDLNAAFGAALYESATVVCLVPSRTDTAWWHKHAMKHEIRFLRGRLKFGGGEDSAPFPSAIVVMRPTTFSLSGYSVGRGNANQPALPLTPTPNLRPPAPTPSTQRII